MFAFAPDRPVLKYAVIPILRKRREAFSFVNELYQIRAPENWASSDRAIAQFEIALEIAGGISYRITKTVEEVSIDKKSGQLFLVAPIDREKVPSISFEVEATSESLSTRINVTLELIDINDNIPIINDQFRTLNAIESSSLSTLTSLNSTDLDSSNNGRIRYTTDKDCPGSVGVDYYSGQVQTRGKLDFASNVNCSIWAYDLNAQSIPSKIDFELLPWTNPDQRSPVGMFNSFVS